MRFFQTVVTVAALAVAMPATALATELDSNSGAGACGGSLGCVSQDNQTLTDPAGSTQLATVIHSQLGDGSTANAHAVASFGAAHVYADAFRAASATLGDAQARGFTRSDDFSIPSPVTTTQNFQLSVTGSHSPTDADYGASAYAYLQLLVQDFTLGGVSLLNYQWSSSDAVPTVSYSSSVVIPANHVVRVELSFEADAYTINYGSDPGFVNGVYPVVSDYSHTARLYIDPAAGSSALALQSGHDYATPGVPEPADWALLMAGFGLTGAVKRRRRAVAA